MIALPWAEEAVDQLERWAGHLLPTSWALALLLGLMAIVKGSSGSVAICVSYSMLVKLPHPGIVSSCSVCTKSRLCAISVVTSGLDVASAVTGDSDAGH